MVLYAPVAARCLTVAFFHRFLSCHRLGQVTIFHNRPKERSADRVRYSEGKLSFTGGTQCSPVKTFGLREEVIVPKRSTLERTVDPELSVTNLRRFL